MNGISLERWREVRAPTFTLVSNMEKNKIVDFAKQLLLFVEVVRETSNIADFEPKVPMRIFVFKDVKEFRVFAGYGVGGFYSASPDENTLMAYQGASSRIVLFHEYTRYLVRNQGLAYPRWFDEGFADLISTVAFREGKAYIGSPPVDRLVTLKTNKKLLALETLFGARKYPKQMLEFYAQAWLTTHYLHTAHLVGEERQLEPMMRYLGQLHDNVPWASAFRTAFRPSADELQQRLIAHRERLLKPGATVPIVVVDVGEPDTSTLELRRLGPGHAALLLGEASLRLGTPATFALSFLEKAQSLDESARSKAAMAIAYARQERFGPAERLVAKASAEAPDKSQVILARGEVQHLHARDSDPVDASLLTESRLAYRLAIEKYPDLPAGYTGLGATYIDTQDDPAEGIAALLRARELAPLIDGHLLNLGKLYLAAKQLKEADATLMEVLRWGLDSPAATEARELLRQMRADAKSDDASADETETPIELDEAA